MTTPDTTAARRAHYLAVSQADRERGRLTYHPDSVGGPQMSVYCRSCGDSIHGHAEDFTSIDADLEWFLAGVDQHGELVVWCPQTPCLKALLEDGGPQVRPRLGWGWDLPLIYVPED